MRLTALAVYICNQWLLGKFRDEDLKTLVEQKRISEEHRIYFLSLKEEN